MVYMFETIVSGIDGNKIFESLMNSGPSFIMR